MGYGTLVQSQINDPANVLQGGVGSNGRLLLINIDDLASYTSSGIDQITAITLAANGKAFVFDGIRQSQKPKFETVAAESGQQVFKHSIEFFIFAYDQVSKNNFARMTQGRYIGLSENAKKNADTIEVYGLEVGMEVLPGSGRAIQELGGAIKVTLTSPEKEYEAKPPRTFDAGTGVYVTNRLAIDALAFLPTIGPTGLSIVTGSGAGANAIVITGTNFNANGSNSAVLKAYFIDNQLGTVIPFTAALVVNAGGTTITTTTPITTAGRNCKVRVLTTQGYIDSAQNYITT